jgi:hypothetical protein
MSIKAGCRPLWTGSKRSEKTLIKKQLHLHPLNGLVHDFLRGALRKAGGCFQDRGQLLQSADRDQKYIGNAQYPVYTMGNGPFIGQRFIPGAAAPFF